MKTRRKHKFFGLSFLAWTWAIMLVIAPLFYILSISFMTPSPEGGGIEFKLTVEHYGKMLEPEFGQILLSSLARSVGLALVTTIGCILIGFPLALFLVFCAGRFRNALFFLLIIPFWTNFLIRTYAWMVILSDNGWLNHSLEIIGFSPQSLSWLFTSKAIFLGMFYNYLPYMAMSLYVSVEKLDVKLLEAAADLGANKFKRFIKITLPLCFPGLVAGSIMVFIPALGEFVIPDVLGGGTSLYVGNLLSQQFLTTRNWPLGSALSVILILVIGLCLAIFEKINTDEETVLA